MFENAKLKVERADHHILDLERQLNSFSKENFHVITSQADTGADTLTVTIGFSKMIKSEIALTIGDAVHNLRTALDHLTWEVVGRDGGKQNRWLKFPTGDTQTSFEAFCKGIETPSIAVKDMFQSLQAFPYGIGRDLYVLHSLDNADKHTVLTPLVQVSRIKNVVFRDAEGKAALTVDSISVVSLETGSDGSSFRLAQFPEGTTVDFQNDAKITPDIFFGDVEFVGEQPVLPTLSQLRDSALETIKLVEMYLT